MVAPLEQAESVLWKKERKKWRKEKPRAIEIKSRQLWMKDLERTEAEKRSHFRTEKEEEMKDLMSLTLSLFPSCPTTNQPLLSVFALTDVSAALITFVTVKQIRPNQNFISLSPQKLPTASIGT